MFGIRTGSVKETRFVNAFGKKPDHNKTPLGRNPSQWRFAIIVIM